jgi:putative MATE family efflux protein
MTDSTELQQSRKPAGASKKLVETPGDAVEASVRDVDKASGPDRASENVEASGDATVSGDIEVSGDMNRVNRMGTGSIPKLVREFAIPAIVGMIVNGAYNLIDTVFLGNFAGDLALTSITQASPIMTITMALSMFVGAGGNALCAIRLGEGKHDEAERVVGNTFILGVIVALVIASWAFIPPVMDFLLNLSSAYGAAREYTRQFLQILFIGSIFQLMSGGMNNFIRTAGAPRRALWTMVIGAIACTLFNALFVAVLHMGVAGSSLATVLGTAVSGSTVIWYLVKTPNVPIRLRRRYFGLRSAVVKSIFALGAASFAIQAGAAIVNFVTNYVLVYYGSMDPIGSDVALATIGVVARISIFVVLPLVGVSIAIQPLLGYNYGARLWNRVLETLKVGMLTAVVIGTAMWLVIMLFASQIAMFFGITDQAQIDLTVYAMRINVALLPIIGLQIVGSNYFQATGQPTKSIILSLTRQLLFLVPLQLLLPVILPQIFDITPLHSIFFSWPCADFLAIFTVGIFMAREVHRVRRLAKESEAGGDDGTASNGSANAGAGAGAEASA